MFPELNFPKSNLNLKKKGGDYFVFDEFRKKELKLTPEEWVRQHILNYLVQEIGYSKGRIISELTINQNGMNKRCDIVVCNEFGKPELIVECKAPEVKITEDTFFQIARYNSVLQVPYLVMSNGLETYICEVMNGEIKFLQEFPKIS